MSFKELPCDYLSFCTTAMLVVVVVVVFSKETFSCLLLGTTACVKSVKNPEPALIDEFADSVMFGNHCFIKVHMVLS